MDIFTTGTALAEETGVYVPDPQAAPAGTGTGFASNTQTPVQRPRLHGGKTFEMADVAKTVTKISGAVEVDMGFEDVSLDDRVRICGEFRVVRVNHRVDKDGSIVREQVLAPLADQALQLVPFDSTNPNDNGIVRMRS